eukprot:scaffold6609_cov34-Tisochrysis_lutea.AAC.2
MGVGRPERLKGSDREEDTEGIIYKRPEQRDKSPDGELRPQLSSLLSCARADLSLRPPPPPLSPEVRPRRREADRQAGRQTARQTDRQLDRQTDR